MERMAVGCRIEHMKALIYRPSKSVTQSGSKKTEKWILEFSRSSSTSIEPIMNWISSNDTQSQVAIAFADRNSIEYTIRNPKKHRIKPKSYSENFSYDKKTPWTH
jgi:hypothetical protein